MAKYWELVPRGCWTVTDLTDALDCLKDDESLAAYDNKSNRINVLGPLGKAVIIDLNKIEDNLSIDELIDLRKKIGNLLGF